MKSSFDKILASSPVDSVAAKVISKGPVFESKKKITQIHTHDPLPMIPFRRHRRRPEEEDLTGVRFGRFTVMGVFDKSYDGAQKDGRIWVVKCVCGRYETRRTKSIKNPRNAIDRCEECRQSVYLEWAENRRRMGLAAANARRDQEIADACQCSPGDEGA